MVPVERQCSEVMGLCHAEYSIWNQGPRHSAISLIARTDISQSQRVAVGVNPLIITPIIHSALKILLPIIRNLSSAPLEALDPKEEKLPPEGKKMESKQTQNHGVVELGTEIPSLAYYVPCATESTDKKRGLGRHGGTYL